MNDRDHDQPARGQPVRERWTEPDPSQGRIRDREPDPSDWLAEALGGTDPLDRAVIFKR